MLILSESNKAIVMNILDQYAKNLEVWAFGSRVNDNAGKYSDLDLVLIGHKPINTRDIWMLNEAFDESMLPIRVDVLDWHTLTDNFRAIIKQNYIVLKKNTSNE